MQHYFLSTALAFIAGISHLTALDAPRTEIAADLAPAPYTLSFNLNALRTGMQIAKPTSLWWDAGFAQQRAHITEQISAAAATEKEVPPFLEAFSSGAAGIMTIYDAHVESWDPIFSVIVDLADAAPAWKNWIEKLSEKERSAAGDIKGYTGYFDRSNNKEFGAFVGSKDSKIIASSVVALRKAGSIDPHTISDAPITVSIDFGAVIDRISYITENDRDRYNYSLWGPMLQGARPSANATINVDAQGWQGTVTINGLGDYQAPAVGDAILKTIPANSALWLVQHLDLNNVLAKIKENTRPEQLEIAKMMTGNDIDSIISWFSGDIAIAVKPAALIPEVSISISLNDEENVLALIAPFVAQQAQELEIEGATKAWIFNLPEVPSPVYLAIGKQTLIASNNSQSITDVFAGTNVADASSASGKAGHLFLDLPVIAQAYLPIIWGELMAAQHDLTPNLLSKSQWSIRSIIRDLHEAETIDKATIDTAIENVWDKEDLQTLFKSEDIAAACMSNISAWKFIDDTKETVGDELFVAYVHTQDGYINVSEWQALPISLEDAQAQVNGMVKFFGADLSTLPVTQIDASPSFDKRWLPTMQQLIGHLPTYEVSLASNQAGQAIVHEQGLPLMTVILSAMGSAIYFDTAERSGRVMRNLKDAQEEVIEEENVTEDTEVIE